MLHAESGAQMPKIKYPFLKIFATLCFAAAVFIMYAASIRCPFLALLRFPCPGCGMTRAFVSLLRGDPARAFSYNPRFILVPIMYVYFILDGHIFGKRADTAVIALCTAYLAVTYAIDLFAFFRP